MSSPQSASILLQEYRNEHTETMQNLEELSVDQLAPVLREGLLHHGNRRLSEAALCYQRAYEQNPQDVDALLLLGIVAREVKHVTAAVQFTRLAVQQRPEAAHLHLNLALAYLASKDLEAALASCRKALELQPGNERTWCALAEIALARGESSAAQKAYEQGMNRPSAKGQAAAALGNLLAANQDYEAALRTYIRGLQQRPNYPFLYLAIGAAKFALGRIEEAKSAYKKALQLKPNYVEAHLNLGNALYHQENFQAAAVSYRMAISLNPNYVKAHSNLGNALSSMDRHKEAIACYERALALQEDSIPARHNLGNAFLHLRDYQRAETCFRRVLEPGAGSAEHHNSLGNALLQQRRLAEAEDCYRSALKLNPDYATAHTNLGNALLALGRREEMQRHYRRSLELDPENPGAHYNFSLSCLRGGNLHEGWPHHEWRWRFRELSLRPRKFRQPQWTGAPLDGATILLHAEQGLGDTIQFLRYLPMVTARGGRILLEVQAQLMHLLQDNVCVEQLIPRGAALPEFDLHCPIMSLPYAFDTAMDTIPASSAYLQIAAPLVQTAWETHPRVPGKLRVGLVWSGNVRFRGNQQRAMTLEALLPLAQVEGVEFFSLQFGPPTEQIAPLQDSFPLIDACSNSKDLTETAALIATLDLVLTVDTSIAHLSGAMGVPVWIMLAQLSDWRWFEEREDSPWYPSARLFRQPTPGDWNSLVKHVCSALTTLVEQRAGH